MTHLVYTVDIDNYTVAISKIIGDIVLVKQGEVAYFGTNKVHREHKEK